MFRLDPDGPAVAPYPPFPSHRQPASRVPTLPDDRNERTVTGTVTGAVSPSVVVPAKVRVPLLSGVPRERLEAQLAGAVERHRLTLVIGPAGSGKSTLLSRFAASSATPVAWYRAEAWDDDEGRLMRHLEAALATTLPNLPTGWRDVETAAAALDAWRGDRCVLVLDDLHALEGTQAERALGRLVEYAPPWLHVLAASRVEPGFNLPRLRVSGDLFEIEADALRFRAWEVERLFRDFYADPVPPGELALLARRTEGWAAGLQLFHLATRGKSADERRRILGVGASSRLVREYLARNVLAELPAELRRFLLDTCVLMRLTGELCDELLDRRGSAAVLAELARRQIFTVVLDEAEGSYRYHEILRSHLDRMLVEEVGEGEARARHRRAAQLLAKAGALAEALVAYCRAEDWNAVRALVGDRGEQVADGSGLRLELLPPALLRDSPWLALASARRLRAEGRWSAALDAFAQAEAGFGPASAGVVCRRERLALAAWLDPVAIPPADWTGVLRAGLAREPLTAARDARSVDEPSAILVRGLLLLAAGEVAEAERLLGAASQRQDLDPGLAVAAAVAAAAARSLAGKSDGPDALISAGDAADRAGLPWIAGLARLAESLAGGIGEGGAAAALPDDPWTTAFGRLVVAWHPGPGEGRVAAAEEAAATFRRLGAGVLEAFARGLGALGMAETGLPDARDAALAAESLARATGTAAPRLFAYAALARIPGDRAAEYELLASTVSRETGMRLPAAPEAVEAAASGNEVRAPSPEIDAGPGPTLRMRVFGGFEIDVGTAAVALDRVKPRARAVLRFLALRPGVAVHRELIQSALWPDADSQTGARSLHVAVSSLRGLLSEALGPAGGRLLVRDEDAYRLAIPPEAVDVGRFEAAMRAGRAAVARGEPGAPSFSVALAAYSGDLLPQDGPAEWVVERREHYRREAVEAATVVAEEALMASDLENAVRVGQQGLSIDRFHDPLWRILIAARDLAGDAGAASRDRRDYAAVLEGLGVAPEAAGMRT